MQPECLSQVELGRGPALGGPHLHFLVVHFDDSGLFAKSLATEQSQEGRLTVSELHCTLEEAWAAGPTRLPGQRPTGSACSLCEAGGGRAEGNRAHVYEWQ
jgi:hypothetical protein